MQAVLQMFQSALWSSPEPVAPLTPAANDVAASQDYAGGSGSGAADLYAGLYDGEKKSVKERFSEQAYRKVGVDKATFDAMDPVERNQLITRAYAKMYQSDPETMKWAGMAAYASDKVGFGMRNAGGLDAVPGVDGGELGAHLAKGNAGIFEDVYWQHLAFEQGGLDAIEESAKAGDLPADQLDAWRAIAAGKEALAKAKASGDSAAIEAAQKQIWSGNTGLLRHEQEIYAQEELYDHARPMFGAISGFMDSPIPGGAAFAGDDIGDKRQRWGWIEESMLPAWQKLDAHDPERVQADMERFQRTPELPAGGAPVWSLDD